MSDRDLLIDRLTDILEALERIPRRFADIKQPSDFTNSESGVDSMDAIAMVLLAVGEELKSIDRKTRGNLLSRYPGVDWRGIIGMRDFLAHGYFHVNPYQLFGICTADIAPLIETVRQMIQDVKQDRA